MPAFAAVDRIGVQTHLNGALTPYVVRFAEVNKALADLGVHYVRDKVLIKSSRLAAGKLVAV